ncbi:MAG: polysaccharide biosynthesis/export family protein [Sedimentisphaerales bacterium]|nr:polysaccharide biosynthesis/export family protein [Sedimentisphaerales bacterium]
MKCVRPITKLIFAAIGAACVIGLSGCFSSRPKDIEAFLKPHQANVAADKYVLQPPDEIEIHCARIPEINAQRQRIRPDGYVTFENVGEFMAAGKTPQELADEMKEKVSTLYMLVGEEPIEVRIMVFRSKVFYVLGQVNIPGPKVYSGRDTLLTAIAEAQLNPMAWAERIQVIRPSADASVRPRIFEVNFDRMSAHGDMTKNILLQEGDVIYVPPTVLAWLGLKVEEIIRPIARAFSGVSTVQYATGTQPTVSGGAASP